MFKQYLARGVKFNAVGIFPKLQWVKLQSSPHIDLVMQTCFDGVRLLVLHQLNKCWDANLFICCVFLFCTNNINTIVSVVLLLLELLLVSLLSVVVVVVVVVAVVVVVSLLLVVVVVVVVCVCMCCVTIIINHHN